MNDLNVIDRFLAAFIQYIDSGFGLLGGDVAFLTSVLVGIDITLAGLFWAMGGDDDIIGRFLKKILYVGAFALILGNFQRLSEIIFRSFAGLGLTAGGGGMSADDLLRPGKLAGTGFEAAWPLLEQASELLGFTSFFDNFLTIAILLLAWLFVIVAFFILAVQLFVTILEFKLTTLAGFVLVPFALWNRTSFLAERVLGNVVTSGIKVMVLAVIVGIGSGFFGEFIGALNGQEPDIGQAMSLVLASLALLGLGIFGPSVASGLVAGAPQLGAGAAVGTTAAAVGTLAVGGGAAIGGARAAGGAALGALRAGTSMGAAASTAYKLGQETSGSPTVGAGLSGVAQAARGAARDRLSNIGGLGSAAERGERAALMAGARTSGGGSMSASASGADEGAGLGAPDARRAVCPSSPANGAPHGPRRRARRRWSHTRHQRKRGIAMKFRRAVQRYGRTPEPVTPYQRAGQVWDERIGSARVQARNWRLMAFGGLLLSTGLSGGLLWLSMQSRVVPYMVEVDRLGDASAIAPLKDSYQPTDPQIAWHLGRFISNVRSVSLDPVLMRQNWLSAYDFVTERGAHFLNEYARSAQPFAEVGDRTVSVQVTSVVRASDRSFQVKWTETAYERGNLAGTSRWTAILSVQVKQPSSADELRKNPLGLRIDGIDWSKELDAGEPARPAPAAVAAPAPAVEPSIPLGSPLDPNLTSVPSRSPALERTSR